MVKNDISICTQRQKGNKRQIGTMAKLLSTPALLLSESGPVYFVIILKVGKWPG